MRIVFAYEFKANDSVGGAKNFVAFELEVVAESLQDRGLVFDHQDAVHACCSSGRMSEKMDPCG